MNEAVERRAVVAAICRPLAPGSTLQLTQLKSISIPLHSPHKPMALAPSFLLTILMNYFRVFMINNCVLRWRD
jgi:hypothetical protein